MIEVVEMGEDGESWMVTNTDDVAVARTAVLDHERSAGNRNAEEMSDLNIDILSGTVEYRTDWWYCPANRVADYILRKGEEEPVPVAFSGTWVSL